jgi:hypothetical protein
MCALKLLWQHALADVPAARAFLEKDFLPHLGTVKVWQLQKLLIAGLRFLDSSIIGVFQYLIGTLDGKLPTVVQQL